MSDVDLCTCGPMTRATGHCTCDDDGPRIYSEPAPEWNVLEEADIITSGQRRQHYGHPSEDFGKVVRMAHALWGRGPETEEEHAIYMIFVKLAREVHEPKRDNLVDIAGYIKCYSEIREQRQASER